MERVLTPDILGSQHYLAAALGELASLVSQIGSAVSPLFTEVKADRQTYMQMYEGQRCCTNDVSLTIQIDIGITTGNASKAREWLELKVPSQVAILNVPQVMFCGNHKNSMRTEIANHLLSNVGYIGPILVEDIVRHSNRFVRAQIHCDLACNRFKRWFWKLCLFRTDV